MPTKMVSLIACEMLINDRSKNQCDRHLHRLVGFCLCLLFSAYIIHFNYATIAFCLLRERQLSLAFVTGLIDFEWETKDAESHSGALTNRFRIARSLHMTLSSSSLFSSFSGE